MTSFKRAYLIAAPCIGAALCLSPSANAAAGEDWEWVVAPYGWAASIGTDLETSVPPSGGISTDTEFDDIVDKLDGAFQIHVEGQGERFGMFADFTYIGLANERTRPRFSSAADLDARLFELAAVWSPSDGTYTGLDVFAGLRYIDLDLSVDIDPVNPAFDPARVDTSESFSDFMLGARYTWSLSDRWGLTLRGDGSFGDTEGTWNTSAVASFRTKSGAWFFGYRYLSVELDADGNKTEITMSGPQIGYGFIF